MPPVQSTGGQLANMGGKPLAFILAPDRQCLSCFMNGPMRMTHGFFFQSAVAVSKNSWQEEEVGVGVVRWVKAEKAEGQTPRTEAEAWGTEGCFRQSPKGLKAQANPAVKSYFKDQPHGIVS